MNQGAALTFQKTPLATSQFWCVSAPLDPCGWCCRVCNCPFWLKRLALTKDFYPFGGQWSLSQSLVGPSQFFPVFCQYPTCEAQDAPRRRALPGGEDEARSRAGRAACSSTSCSPLQHGQGSNQGLLSSQRHVQAAANFMNLALNFLGFYLRTPRNKLSVTFYPRVWGFF